MRNLLLAIDRGVTRNAGLFVSNAAIGCKRLIGKADDHIHLTVARNEFF
jgi:hypothetical protein